jgi:hypothetical protein
MFLPYVLIYMGIFNMCTKMAFNTNTLDVVQCFMGQNQFGHLDIITTSTTKAELNEVVTNEANDLGIKV